MSTKAKISFSIDVLEGQVAVYNRIELRLSDIEQIKTSLRHYMELFPANRLSKLKNRDLVGDLLLRAMQAAVKVSKPEVFTLHLTELLDMYRSVFPEHAVWLEKLKDACDSGQAAAIGEVIENLKQRSVK